MGNFDEWQLHQNDLQTNNPAVHPSQADTRRQVERERPIHVTGLTGFCGGTLVRDELVLFTGRKSPWERHKMKEAWDDMKEDFLQKGGELGDAVHKFVTDQFITQNDGANTGKAPKDMFGSVKIPNDLNLVAEAIEQYNN